MDPGVKRIPHPVGGGVDQAPTEPGDRVSRGGGAPGHHGGVQVTRGSGVSLLRACD